MKPCKRIKILGNDSQYFNFKVGDTGVVVSSESLDDGSNSSLLVELDKDGKRVFIWESDTKEIFSLRCFIKTLFTGEQAHEY